MTKEEIIKLRDSAEQTRVQFKERVTRDNRYDVSCEMVAQSNSHGGLIVEDIMKGTSMPRNEFLFTNANYLLPYTGAGTGIIRAMEEKPEVTFENLDSAHEFVTIIRRKPGVGVQESVQESVQENVQETNQEKPIKVSLTGHQKDIVNFCSVPRTAAEILNRLELSQHSANRKRHIQPLLDLGVLEMTIPENPNDRNQKYRKVRK